MKPTPAPSRSALTRREVLTNTALAGSALLAGLTLLAPTRAAVESAPRRKRYALVGVGSRSSMYRKAVHQTYAEHAEMVGYCDVNRGRLDLAKNDDLKQLYLDQEKYDGYFRDQCVFRPDIDIEDTMNVIVKYNTGATLSYSLNAFNAWEGYEIAFIGTQGRIEHGIQEQVTVFGDGSTPGAVKPGGAYIRVFPLRKPAYAVEHWPSGRGSHAGGDSVMLDDLFLPEKPADKYQRAADQRSGAYSILTGIAANHAFLSNEEVKIDDLVSDIGLPDYPAMPTHAGPLPMPPRG